jgi:hypothetical protein
MPFSSLHRRTVAHPPLQAVAVVVDAVSVALLLYCAHKTQRTYLLHVYVQIKALAMTLTEAGAALAAALQSRAGTGASLTPELKDLLQAAALPAATPGALADAVVASLTGISAADKQASLA